MRTPEEQKELEEAAAQAKPILERMFPEDKPYDQIDHSHCWQEKNPPCGIKGKHRCCLCELPVPEDIPKSKFTKENMEAYLKFKRTMEQDIPEIKEFDKLFFNGQNSGYFENGKLVPAGKHAHQVDFILKNFIPKSTLRKALFVEVCSPGGTADQFAYDPEWYKGYNQALSDLKKLLE